MAKATLTISSKNYSSWSLRGWLLAKLRRPRLQGGGDPARRCRRAQAKSCCCRRRSWCRACTHDGIKVWDTLAIARIPERNQAQGRAAAGRPRGARALPRDLRRDAFGLRQPALGAADEPQGALSRTSRSGRARRPTSSASRRSGSECLATYGGPFLFGKRPHGRRDVRAGRHALRDLRREARPQARAYGSAILAMPEMQRVDRRPRSSSPRRSTNSTWSSERARATVARRVAHASGHAGPGTGHGPPSHRST